MKERWVLCSRHKERNKEVVEMELIWIAEIKRLIINGERCEKNIATQVPYPLHEVKPVVDLIKAQLGINDKN